MVQEKRYIDVVYKGRSAEKERVSRLRKASVALVHQASKELLWPPLFSMHAVKDLPSISHRLLT